MTGNISALQEITAATLAAGIAGVWVALLYVRGALRSQKQAAAIYKALAERYLGEPPPADDPPLPVRLFPPLSLKCRIYGANPHSPCSGTSDDGTGARCWCWCHEDAGGLRPREPSELLQTCNLATPPSP